MKKITGGQDFMNSWAVFQIRRKYLYAPAAVVEDTKLSSSARILFILITSFSRNVGYCYAGNEILCIKLGVKVTMMKKYLKELKENQLIKVKIYPKHKNPRQIYINFEELRKRYPKLPIKIPASAKVGDKARKIMERP